MTENKQEHMTSEDIQTTIELLCGMQRFVDNGVEGKYVRMPDKDLNDSANLMQHKM